MMMVNQKGKRAPKAGQRVHDLGVCSGGLGAKGREVREGEGGYEHDERVLRMLF